MQSLQMTYLAAETSGEILVAFWPKHHLRSGLRMPDLPWEGIPPEPPTCSHLHMHSSVITMAVPFLAPAPDQTYFHNISKNCTPTNLYIPLFGKTS